METESTSTPVSDTDGDGMPDGFEAWMEIAGGFDEVTQRYVCPYFDPLNADQADDPDEDGFDVDRTVSSRLQNNTPLQKSTATACLATLPRIGWFVVATLPRLCFDPVPFITNGMNASFVNILSACTTNVSNVVGEDLWLGTDLYSTTLIGTAGMDLRSVHYPFLR